MNYSTAIFLFNQKARAVVCVYEAGDDAPRIVFKTLDPKIEVNDYVVVPTKSRHNMTVCKVVEVDIEPDLESPTEMAWIIGVVDRADFEEHQRLEEQAINAIKVAERKRKREELAKTMLQGAELKGLPIYETGETELPQPAPTTSGDPDIGEVQGRDEPL